MFEKFGKCGSTEEINECARGLKEEGDTEGLILFAKENGLDKEDAKDYISGDMTTFTTPLVAAVARVTAECAELGAVELFEDWKDYICELAQEETEARERILLKNKSFAGCVAELLKWSYDHMYDVPREIVKAAGVSHGNVKCGTPGNRTAKRIIRGYYLGGAADAKN